MNFTDTFSEEFAFSEIKWGLVFILSTIHSAVIDLIAMIGTLIQESNLSSHSSEK